MRMLVSRQTAMKFIQEVNIGPRIHSPTCLTGEIPVLLSGLPEILSFLSNLKVQFQQEKMRLWGERATILRASSDCNEMYISNWLMLKFLSYFLNSRLAITELIITISPHMEKFQSQQYCRCKTVPDPFCIRRSGRVICFLSFVRSWIQAFVKRAIQIQFPYDSSKMSVAL